MQMQEPEQWQQSEAEPLTRQEYGDNRTDYSRVDEPQQEEKIYPQTEQKLNKTFWIITVVLSSIGFFLSLTGMVASIIVLRYANEPGRPLAGEVLGLISSILVLLVCVAIFVMAVIILAGPTRRGRRWGRRRWGNRVY